MSFNLTANACSHLTLADMEDDIFQSPVTLQVLSTKKVPQSKSVQAQDRYRIILSDGIHYIQAMLATQLNTLVDEETVTKNTVVIVEKMTCSIVQERRLIVVLEVRVLGTPSEKIGSPISLNKADDTPAPAQGISNASTSEISRPQQPQQKQSGQPQRTGSNGKSNWHPIEGLSPYQNTWTIKARCTHKSDIKTWSNQRGEGKLFNVTLMDETGEIRGTAFNTVADDLYSKFEEGKVYYVSKARVNLAKKMFSNLANDYELGFERNTVVEECLETTGLPMVKYNFVPLAGLEDIAKDATCDVIAIVKEVGTVSEIVSKATSRATKKRELTLVDQSNYSVRLTLWGKQAEQYQHENEQPVIAFKGVKVGDFGGRSLSMVSSSMMSVNPDMEEAFSLRGWYDNEGKESTFQAHNRGSAAGGSAGGFNRSQIRSLLEVKESEMGLSDKTEYFSTRATIMHIKSDNIAYPACQNEGCNKKVVENGKQWRCEKCDQNFDSPSYRYIISMAVADWSGQAWLSGFNEVGQMIFDMSADALMAKKNEDDSHFNAIMHRVNGATYNFSCRAKQDSYNDTVRVRYGISRINKLDYKEECNALLDLLNTPWASRSVA
ncbi:replication factor-a protein [Guyanagaster necrorhizus]|uniref:Replication protein A subunit n=1 Tax=Guyanagaster necrorhizus TaxID=856835 RepID=A0A9P7VX47_9AGAR|nr:replication factor-a protein [Guyanagaster necrorhizus MCA 3950]KAG7448223.1 replication factor-a protein [Guyanagaster necrorhizus MCA 3950]